MRRILANHVILNRSGQPASLPHTFVLLDDGIRTACGSDFLPLDVSDLAPTPQGYRAQPCSGCATGTQHAAPAGV